jgi:hypothetical protein
MVFVRPIHPSQTLHNTTDWIPPTALPQERLHITSYSRSQTIGKATGRHSSRIKHTFSPSRAICHSQKAREREAYDVSLALNRVRERVYGTTDRREPIVPKQFDRPTRFGSGTMPLNFRFVRTVFANRCVWGYPTTIPSHRDGGVIGWYRFFFILSKKFETDKCVTQ